MKHYKQNEKAARIIEKSFDDAFGALREAMQIENQNISDHAIDKRLKAIFGYWQSHNEVLPEDIE